MKKFMFTWTICIGILVSLYGFIYSFTSMNSIIPGGYLWISLASLGVYFCEKADIKLLPNYIVSSLAGLFWGFAGITAVGYFMARGLNATIIICSVLLVVTVCVILIHMILLEKTWLNKTPMIFVTLAFIFSQNGQNIFYIAFSIIGGFLLGAAISFIGSFLAKKMVPQQNA